MNQILFAMKLRSIHYRTCNTVIKCVPMTLIKRPWNLLLYCCFSKYLTSLKACMETRLVTYSLGLKV